MRSHVFGSTTAIQTPFFALISSALSCCPWSASKFHTSQSCSAAVNPFSFVSLLGRMKAIIIAKPIVSTPSIRKS